MTLRTFISHAGEDTERFVKPFGERLLAQGVDVWVDFWELRDGDSLVQKIFEQGIGSAEAILVVISKYSVHKAWLQKELNVSVVRQIEEGIRLVPVFIDDVQTPVALRDTKYRRIRDIANFDADVDELVMSLHGYNDKPALGEVPEYARERAKPVSGLTDLDSQVLKFAGDLTVETDAPTIDAHAIFRRAATLGISESQAQTALEVLLEGGYLTEKRVSSGIVRVFMSLALSPQGFETYLETYFAGYGRLFVQVSRAIAVDGRRRNSEIARELQCPQVVVDHIFDVLKAERLIDFKLFWDGHGGRLIYSVSPKLSRT